MKLSKNVGQWLSFLLLGVCLIGLYEIFENMGIIGGVIGSFVSILTPFIAGFAIAFVLYAPVKKLDTFIRRCPWKWVQKIARPVSVFVVYVLALALVAAFLCVAVPAIVNAVTDFAKQLPAYSEKVIKVVNELTAEGGWLAGFGLASRVQELYSNLQQFLTTWLEKFLTAEKLIGYLSSVLKVATSLLDVVLAFIVSVYMLLSKEALVRAVKTVFGLFCKPKTMALFSEYLHKTAKIVYNYVYSQAIDAVVVGVLATIGFLLARMPNAAALGMMLGILNMIPYFGALIGGVVCVLVALLSGNFYGAVFVGLYILVMQQIDANVIQPRIVGQTVGLRPLYVLLGITVGGGLFGFWGIFLGVPAMAVIQMLLTDYIAARKAKTEPLPPAEEKSEE